MIQTRGFWVYVLSLLALLFLIALGVTADHDPGLRDLPMRIAPRDEWQMLDWGLIGSPSRLPFFWSSKHSRERTINTPEVIGLRLTWRHLDSGRSAAYVGQEISSYRTESTAVDAYRALITENFDRGSRNEVTWVVPSDLDVPARADEAMLQCLGDETDYQAWEKNQQRQPGVYVSFPRRDCVLVARYAGLVVELRGTIFHRNWMTASQFQRVLRDMDYRVSRLVPRWRDLHEKSSDHHELQ